MPESYEEYYYRKQADQFSDRASKAYRAGDYAEEKRMIDAQEKAEKQWFKEQERHGNRSKSGGFSLCLIMCLGMSFTPIAVLMLVFGVL